MEGGVESSPYQVHGEQGPAADMGVEEEASGGEEGPPLADKRVQGEEDCQEKRDPRDEKTEKEATDV